MKKFKMFLKLLPSVFFQKVSTLVDMALIGIGLGFGLAVGVSIFTTIAELAA